MLKLNARFAGDSKPLILGVGLIVIAIIVLVFAQSQISQIDADRNALGGLGGVGQDLSDALGVTDYEGRRQTAVALKAVSIAGLVGGGILTIIGLRNRKGN